MKNYIIILLIILSSSGYSQDEINAFQAAQWIPVILKDAPDLLDDNLKSFANDPFKVTEDSFGRDEVRSYLESLSKAINRYQENDRGIGPQGFGGSLKSIVSPEKQTMILDAAAQIIAEQFREGVTKMYLNKLKKKLDSIEELRILLPETYDLLDKSSPFDFPDLGNDFKKAFEEDLKNLPTNFIKLVDESEKMPYSTWRSKKWYAPVRISFDIGDKLIAGYHPAEVLNYLDQKYENPPYKDIDSDLNERLSDYHKYIQLINVIQFNFQDLEKEKPGGFQINTGQQFENLWINFSDLKKLDTKEEIKYFVALIYYQLSPDAQTMFKIFIKKVTEIDLSGTLNLEEYKRIYNDCLMPFLEILHKIDALTADKVSNAEEASQLMEYVIDAFDLIYSKLRDDKGQITLDNKGTIVTDDDVTIDAKELVSLTKKGVSIYSSIVDKDYNKIIPDLIYLTKFIAQDSNGSISNSQLLELINSLRKYGSLIEAVAKAETSGEMKEIIKKEITSFDYMKKRSSRSSLTLSAHPGIFGARERLFDKSSDENGTLFGLTAPIGIEWALNIRRNGKANSTRYLHYVDNKKIKTLSGATIGIFIQLLDVGAVVNYRINDSDSELPDNITFKEVFSPGAAVHYGFRNSPLTLGFGYQYTPEIRKVTVDDISKESNAGRVFMRLTWDINFIKFYSK